MRRSTPGSDRITWTTRSYHQWTIAPDTSLTLAQATEKAESLLHTAHRQLESEVPLRRFTERWDRFLTRQCRRPGRLSDALQTFNVRFRGTGL